MARAERFHQENWTVDVYLVQGVDSQTFCGVADISLGREHRCKMVLTKPETSREEGLAALKTKCLIWIKTEGARLLG